MLFNVIVTNGYFQGIELGYIDGTNRKDAQSKIDKLLFVGIQKKDIELKEVTNV